MTNRAYRGLPCTDRPKPTRANRLRGTLKQSPIAVYSLNDGGVREDAEIAANGKVGVREKSVVEVLADREVPR